MSLKGPLAWWLTPRGLLQPVLNLSRLEASSRPKPLASADTLQSHTRYVRDAEIFPPVLQVFEKVLVLFDYQMSDFYITKVIDVFFVTFSPLLLCVGGPLWIFFSLVFSNPSRIDFS